MNINNINNTTARYALRYCIETFGLSKYYEYEIPEIHVYDYKPDNSNGFSKTDIAFFDDENNQIIIFRPNVKSFINFIDTIIHEYIHYMQDLSDYNDLEIAYGYDDHPLELEANKIAEEHKWNCKNYVKNLLEKNANKRNNPNI
jgi:hypothetical protein